jgi:hypothetical protein
MSFSPPLGARYPPIITFSGHTYSVAAALPTLTKNYIINTMTGLEQDQSGYSVKYLREQEFESIIDHAREAGRLIFSCHDKDFSEHVVIFDPSDSNDMEFLWSGLAGTKKEDAKRGIQKVHGYSRYEGLDYVGRKVKSGWLRRRVVLDETPDAVQIGDIIVVEDMNGVELDSHEVISISKPESVIKPLEETILEKAA